MNAQLIGNVVRIALAATVMLVVVRQCRKPAWWLGRLTVGSMNKRHLALTDWGLSHVQIARDFTMLDVGCGGGRTMHTLAAAAPEGKVSGIDYSEASVAASRRYNAAAIAEGRMDVQRSSVSALPFPPSTFDLVTAIETHYYWPDLPGDVKEILRVLKPGGSFLIIAETYKGRRFDWIYRPAMMLLGATYLTVDEHRDLLTAAGFADVEVFVEQSRGWICAMGKK